MKTINWRYAIGEVFLIFLGITLAIAFQNWNEQRKLNQLEFEVLKQLKIALDNDSADVNLNITTHTRALANCQKLLESLNGSEPLAEQTFIVEAIQALDYTFLISDVSTYEYLIKIMQAPIYGAVVILTCLICQDSLMKSVIQYSLNVRINSR